MITMDENETTPAMPDLRFNALQDALVEMNRHIEELEKLRSFNATTMTLARTQRDNIVLAIINATRPV